MDLEKIEQELNKRFSIPKPPFTKRRIVVWIDEAGDFKERIDEISLKSAKILALTGTNNFVVKKILHDDPESDYLIYRPFDYESPEENWLLDVELLGEEFRADLVSIWMNETGLTKPSLRRSFIQYKSFFNSQERRKKFAALPNAPETKEQLESAIMAAIADLKDASPSAIIKAALRAGLRKDENAVYQDFLKYGLADAFWEMARRDAGYQDKDRDLGRLAARLLLTAASRTLSSETLEGLQSHISASGRGFCYDFVSEWALDKDADELRRIAEIVESELKLPQRFMAFQASDLATTGVFPCFDEIILIKLMEDVGNHVVDVDAILQIVEKRRAYPWYVDYKNYYEGLYYLAKMQTFYKEHSAGFHIVEPEKLWEKYATEYYVMDVDYREFHKRYAASLKLLSDSLSDRFKDVAEVVEGLYSTWFLEELGAAWTNACAKNLREYGSAFDGPRQTDFYDRYVRPYTTSVSGNKRICVVISDALRYEVAATLAEQLRQETQAEVELKTTQGVFPTITKFGMAALLPHKTLGVAKTSDKSDPLTALADGASTDAPNRDKILKDAHSTSVALKYKDVVGMKRDARKALVKGMKVVYIYHDAIDVAGHQESDVFTACDEAIAELKNCVRIIVNEWNGTNVIIASDHGFLYTERPLGEDAKVGASIESDRIAEIGRRYVIAKKGAQSESLTPVKFLWDDANYDAFAPRGNVRIKTKGAGIKFVHGGVSLQEMVVPIIEYHYLRNQNKEYQKNKSKYDVKPVEIELLSSNRKICNMIFSLNFYQKEGRRESRSGDLQAVFHRRR